VVGDLCQSSLCFLAMRRGGLHWRGRVNWSCTPPAAAAAADELAIGGASHRKPSRRCGCGLPTEMGLERSESSCPYLSSTSTTSMPDY
jgi:hypothetical protein